MINDGPGPKGPKPSRALRSQEAAPGMRHRGGRSPGSGSRGSQGHRPGGARGGHTDTRTHGQSDTQSAAPPQGPHPVTNPPPPAQPISEQPARRRPIKAPSAAAPAGQPMAGRCSPWGRGAAPSPPAGPAGSGGAEEGQSSGRGIAAATVGSLRGRPSCQQLSAPIRACPRLGVALPGTRRRGCDTRALRFRVAGHEGGGNSTLRDTGLAGEL